MADFCDFARLQMRWRPNRWLMLPPGFESLAIAHEDSPVFAAAPDALFRRLEAVVADEPRIRRLVEDRGEFRLELVQRSRIFRFPDRVSVAVLRCAGYETSALAVYSRARISIWDFGVNRARVRRWVRALQAGGRYSSSEPPSS